MTSTRREFLTNAGRVVVALPAGVAIFNSLSCGSNECASANDIEVTATDVTVTSLCTSNHVHTFDISTADLQSPPADGLTGSTSTYEGHKHAIALSQADLASLHAGGTVEVISGASDGHTHLFKFRAMA
jgi:hypothetical protein